MSSGEGNQGEKKEIKKDISMPKTFNLTSSYSRPMFVNNVVQYGGYTAPAQTGANDVHFSQKVQNPYYQQKREMLNKSGSFENTGSGSKTGKKELPDNLKAYITRCFEQCKDDEEKDKMELFIRDFLSKIIKNKTAFINDWEEFPLPNMSVVLKQKLAAKAQEAPKSLVKPLEKSNNNTNNNNNNNKSNKNKNNKSLRAAEPERRGRNVEAKVGVSKKSIKQKKNNTQEESAGVRQKKDRVERFKSSPVSVSYVVDASAAVSFGESHIVGTCTDLEKDYFRLTQMPEACKIRPLSVLLDAYAFVLKKYKKTKNYNYFCEQFKSIRQDLTIQNIKNEFAVNTYETHAKIALKCDDISEFNQCQSVLKAMYQEQENSENRYQFLSLRILYLIYTQNMLDMCTMLKELLECCRGEISFSFVEKERYTQEDYLKVALKLYSSWLVCDSYNFFRCLKILYGSKLKFKYLINKFVDRERAKTINCLCAVFKVKITPDMSERFLGVDEDELKSWLVEKNVFEAAEQVDLSCKALQERL